MSNIILPNNQLLQNQAKLILKGQGLSLLKPKFFVIDQKKVTQEGTAFETNAPDSYDKTSQFGTPVFDIVSIAAHSYTDENGKTVNNAKLELDMAILEVNKPKNIVITKVAGRNGTIKEFMSDDDYHISIRGTLVNPLAYSHPADLIRYFDEVTKTPMELKVESTFLSLFEIFSIVIVDSKVSQREGSRNIVDYELTCISDTPFEILSENENTNHKATSFF